jgi:hypothetical protein
MVAAITVLTDQSDVDALIRDLRHLHRAAGLELMVGIGRLIVDRLYAGDVEVWRSRGRKDTSFRKLAAHPELPFQASTLYRAVEIYLLAQRRPDVALLKRVGPSHLQEILGVDKDLQDHLLDRAEAEGWSTRRLREEVRGGRRLDGHAPLRVPTFQRCVSQLRDRVDARALLTDIDCVDSLDVEAAGEMLGVVRTLCQQAESLARRLSARVSAAELAAERRAAWPDEEPSGIRAHVMLPQRKSGLPAPLMPKKQSA